MKIINSDAFDELTCMGPASYLRGHSQKFVKERVGNCEARNNFFTNRVLRDWNQLEQNTVTATSINSFKNRIDTDFFEIDTKRVL